LPPALQVTVTGQDPSVVPEPIVQVQVTSPEPLAVSGLRPWAFDGPDLYSTMMAHEAPAAVRAASVAEAPRDTGELMLEIVTVIAPLGGTFVGLRCRRGPRRPTTTANTRRRSLAVKLEPGGDPVGRFLVLGRCQRDLAGADEIVQAVLDQVLDTRSNGGFGWR